MPQNDEEKRRHEACSEWRGDVEQRLKRMERTLEMLQRELDDRFIAERWFDQETGRRNIN